MLHEHSIKKANKVHLNVPGVNSGLDPRVQTVREAVRAMTCQRRCEMSLLLAE
jgi:hypothetical protein